MYIYLNVTSICLLYFESIGFYVHTLAMTSDLTVGQNINRVRNLELVLFHDVLFHSISYNCILMELNHSI